MQDTRIRFSFGNCLRLVGGAGLVLSLALPALPAAAQEIGTGPIPTTSANCSIHLSVANPSPGDEQIPRSVVMSGQAFDQTVTSGTGISKVQAFIGARGEGGLLIGTASFATEQVAAPQGFWSMTASIPDNVSGGRNIFVYAMSNTGAEAIVTYPIVVGETLSTPPPAAEASSFCPVVMAPTTPSSPAVALAH